MCRNFLARLVLTFEMKGGLYHVMFLVHFLLFFRACSCGGLYIHTHIFINPIAQSADYTDFKKHSLPKRENPTNT